MQLLKIPPFYDAMQHSMSVTGITFLKKGSYKSRYDLPNDLIQVRKKGVCKKRLTDYKRNDAKKVRRSTAVGEDTMQNRITAQKNRQYKIDKKQVRHRIINYLSQMKGEKMLYFWTITFPPGTNDDTTYKLFNKWLTRLRHEKMIASYLWVVERQQNNTLHFHMVVNKKMCVKKANKFMRASIMHCINSSEIDYDRVKAMRYNGVDIAKDRKTKRVVNFAKQKRQKALSNYLSKYVTKNDTWFTRLAWHCSRHYSILVTQIRLTEREFERLPIMQFCKDEPLFESEWCIFYTWKDKPPESFESHLAQVNRGLIEIFC